MRNRFDRQLEELNEMLIHMGELCETAIEEATGALEGHDIARAKAVITADSEIDQMEKDDHGYGTYRRSDCGYCRYCDRNKINRGKESEGY